MSNWHFSVLAAYCRIYRIVGSQIYFQLLLISLLELSFGCWWLQKRAYACKCHSRSCSCVVQSILCSFNPNSSSHTLTEHSSQSLQTNFLAVNCIRDLFRFHWKLEYIVFCDSHIIGFSLKKSHTTLSKATVSNYNSFRISRYRDIPSPNVPFVCTVKPTLLFHNKDLSVTHLFVISSDSREQAFVQALSSAALVHAISKACSAGHSSKCGCGPIPNDPPPTPPPGNGLNGPPGSGAGQFKWGGCADDLRFGLVFGKWFTDTPTSNSRKISRRAVINSHNNAVGRKVRL
jgi:hypothetical protein